MEIGKGKAVGLPLFCAQPDVDKFSTLLFTRNLLGCSCESSGMPRSIDHDVQHDYHVGPAPAGGELSVGVKLGTLVEPF